MTSNPESAEDYELLPSSSQAAEEVQKPAMGREEQFLKAENRNGDPLASYAALGASTFTLVVTWYGVFGDIDEHKNTVFFLLHPTLQSLALILVTYGIMTLQPTSQPKTKAAGLSRHQAAILFIGFPALLVGTLAVAYNKWLHGSHHFKTWHGKFGLITTLWMITQVLLGGGSVWFGGAAFGGGAKAKSVWKYHRLSGYVLFPLLLLTISFGGAWSHWGERHFPLSVRILAYGIAPVVSLTAVCSRTRLSKMKFF